MPMMAITTSSSTSVNPSQVVVPLRSEGDRFQETRRRDAMQRKPRRQPHMSFMRKHLSDKTTGNLKCHYHTPQGAKDIQAKTPQIT